MTHLYCRPPPSGLPLSLFRALALFLLSVPCALFPLFLSSSSCGFSAGRGPLLALSAPLPADGAVLLRARPARFLAAHCGSRLGVGAWLQRALGLPSKEAGEKGNENSENKLLDGRCGNLIAGLYPARMGNKHVWFAQVYSSQDGMYFTTHVP